MRVVAIVVGAGRGERLGHALPKAFVPLAGRPLLVHALAALGASAAVEGLLPVLPADVEAPAGLLAGAGLPPGVAAKCLAPVAGGARRQDSVGAGLAALPPGVEIVAVHDAARPLVRPDAVSRVVEAARGHGAALLAVPVGDTLKRVRDGRVIETPPRDEWWAAQTPQAFRVELLREALAKAEAEGRTGTDCAQLVEALGVAVHVVRGDPENVKITHPADLALAARILEERP